MKPHLSLSLDLDNKWSYMKIHGEPGWESYPSYLDLFIPKILEVLERFDLKITFFIVGRDITVDSNRRYLEMLVEKGHELANHSFNHDTWLHLYTREQMEQEIVDTEGWIARLSGQRPVSFRGPGYSSSPDLLDVLAERGYLCDATSLPTFIGPLARRYYFKNSTLTREEKCRRNKIFGAGVADGFGPLKPFLWQLPSGRNLLEIPVTTMPVLRTPFHMSYLLYLSRISDRLMKGYLGLALNLCRFTGTEPSFLLHPLDLLDAGEVPELPFFPGMDIPSDRKRELLLWVLGELSREFAVVNMSTHACLAIGQTSLRRSAVRLPANGVSPARLTDTGSHEGGAQ